MGDAERIIVDSQPPESVLVGPLKVMSKNDGGEGGGDGGMACMGRCGGAGGIGGAGGPVKWSSRRGLLVERSLV